MTLADEPESITADNKVTSERMHPAGPLVNTWIMLLAGGYFLVSTIIQQGITWDDTARIGQVIAEAPLWLLAILGLLVVTLGYSYWSWWTTKLVMDTNELRVENTGAFQESKRIAYTRIQAVDLKQPLAARLLGLAELSVEVGAETPTKLAYLSRKRATAIRDYLMARAHKQQVTTEDTSREASAWDDTAQGDEILVRLHPGDIILGALLSTELPLLLLVFLGPLTLSIWFEIPLIALGVGVIPFALALIGFLSKRVVNQYNYTLAHTPAGLRITRGLTTLNSQTIPAHRVQSITISQPLSCRPIRRAKLSLTMLGGIAETAEETIYLPIGNAQQVQIAIAALWPTLSLQTLRFTRTPERARWLSLLSWSWLGSATDPQVLAIRRGWFTRKQTIIPHARMQCMQIRQGPFERRLKLATVVAHSSGTSGITAIKHLDLAQARRLAFNEMDVARIVRNRELTFASSTAGWQLTSPTHPSSTDQADLWTPNTSMHPGVTNPPVVQSDTELR